MAADSSVSSSPEIEEGQLRLEVRLYGPEVQRDNGYGPRPHRERYVDLDLPVTWMGWAYINYLIQNYTKPEIILTPPRDSGK